MADAVLGRAFLVRIEELHGLAGFHHQNRVDRQVDVAVGARHLSHHRIVKEGHVALGDRDDRNLDTTRCDPCYRLHRDLRLAAVPARELAARVGSGERQHLRRVTVEVIVARSAEEDFRWQCLGPESGPCRSGRIDVPIPLRIMLHAHEIALHS